jgi:hypothetical protein
MSEELAVYESKPLTVNDIKGQVDLIQNVMKSVMQKDQHYGLIPGCGDKPALLKPGAEKLNLTFRMAPDPETEIVDMGVGKSIFGFVERAQKDKRTILATIVGDKPAKVPPEIGVWVVESGEVK